MSDEKKIKDIDLDKAMKDLHDLQSRPIFTSGLLVVLEEGTMTPIADDIANAIKLIKGVVDVKIQPTDHLEECLVKSRISSHMRKNFNKILDGI